MRVTLTMIVLAVAVPVMAGADQPRGVAACPTPAAPSQCAAPVKAAARSSAPARSVAKTKPSTPAALATLVSPDPVTTAGSWKSALDPLTAGGWVLISDGPLDNPSVVYASTHNVLRDGNVVTAWIRWEYSRIQAEIYPLHYQSAVTHEQLDCDARSYRRAAVFYYRRNNLEDKALQFTALDDDTTWRLAIPGSEADAMLNWACTPPAAPRHTVAKSTGTPSADKPDDKSKAAGGKSGAAAAAAASAPSPAPAAAGGLDLHTKR
ncbi:MAG TPA: surface-adhesin E family protein [Steroidobacteraceae bacterium]|nr:surface-adhesin E family protein [Steroidobacteraceae bacterium]